MCRYVGRADSQVKLRGFRLELGEVEAVLAAVGGVQDAVAVLQVGNAAEPSQILLFALAQQRQMADGETPSHLQDANTPTAVLVAYVTPETADEAVLLAAAHAKLPAYMVPSAIVKLAELPRLASGKVRCLLVSHISCCF